MSKGGVMVGTVSGGPAFASERRDSARVARAAAAVLAVSLAVALAGCGTQVADSGVDRSQGYVGASVSRPDGADGAGAETGGANAPSAAAEKSTVVPELASMNVGSARLIEVPAEIATGEPDLATTFAVERVYKLSDEQAAGLNALKSEGEVKLTGGQYVGVVKDSGRKPASLQVFGSGTDTQVRVVPGEASEEFVSSRCECDAVDNPGFIERAWIVPLAITVDQASGLVTQ